MNPKLMYTEYSHASTNNYKLTEAIGTARSNTTNQRLNKMDFYSDSNQREVEGTYKKSPKIAIPNFNRISIPAKENEPVRVQAHSNNSLDLSMVDNEQYLLNSSPQKEAPPLPENGNGKHKAKKSINIEVLPEFQSPSGDIRRPISPIEGSKMDASNLLPPAAVNTATTSKY